MTLAFSNNVNCWSQTMSNMIINNATTSWNKTQGWSPINSITIRSVCTLQHILWKSFQELWVQNTHSVRYRSAGILNGSLILFQDLQTMWLISWYTFTVKISISQYLSLNSNRLATGSIHTAIDGVSIGQHPLVSRLLWGDFSHTLVYQYLNLVPRHSRRKSTWYTLLAHARNYFNKLL